MSLLEAAAPSEVTLEAGGHAKGVAVAIVRQNKDDSGLGRVKVSYPWHSQPQESYWARVAMPMAGSKRGVYFIPEVQDEVLVAFERGDVRFPYVVGSLWNGKDPSPETNADGNNDVRGLRSRKGHKLTFNDGKKGLLQLELNDGKKIAIDDDGIVIDDGKGNSVSIQTKSGSISIQAATKVEIKAPEISIQSSGALELKAGPSMSLNAGVININ
jgi:uncharacterized protein involved in type VI secretion and phage assembly